MQKVCTCCKQEKLIEFFPKNKSSKDGYYRLCKNCSNTEGKKYYVINKLELNKRRATYWKHYKQSHKTVRNNRDNERRKIDPGFRLTNNMRNRIRLALLNNVMILLQLYVFTYTTTNVFYILYNNQVLFFIF